MSGVSDYSSRTGITLLLLAFIASEQAFKTEINRALIVDRAFSASNLGTPANVSIAKHANLRSQ